MKTSQKNDEVYKALFELSKFVTNIGRSEENPFLRSKYVPLDRILEVIRDPLSANGLMIASSPSFKDGVVTVETRIIHAISSQWVSVSPSAPVVPAIIDKKIEGVYVTPQGVGAAITYLRRYGLMSLLGLAETDDDGNLASGTPRDERSSWTGPLDLEELTKGLRSLWAKIEKVQDIEKLDPILWGYQELITQCKADLPDRWDGTDGIKGIQTLIDQKREKLTQSEPVTSEELLEEIENRISGVTDPLDLETLRQEYDEHAGLALPDIREKAQDMFNIKQIELAHAASDDEGTEEAPESPVENQADKTDDTPENEETPQSEQPVEEEPVEEATRSPRVVLQQLMAKIETFSDYNDLAAWDVQITDDIEWIAKVSPKSAEELNEKIKARLAELEDSDD